jgi:hypothetical protein
MPALKVLSLVRTHDILSHYSIWPRRHERLHPAWHGQILYFDFVRSTSTSGKWEYSTEYTITVAYISGG